MTKTPLKGEGLKGVRVLLLIDNLKFGNFKSILLDYAQKGTKQANGRHRGGLSTKIYAVVDVLGDPLRFELTRGAANDCL